MRKDLRMIASHKTIKINMDNLRQLILLEEMTTMYRNSLKLNISAITMHSTKKRATKQQSISSSL